MVLGSCFRHDGIVNGGPYVFSRTQNLRRSFGDQNSEHNIATLFKQSCTMSMGFKRFHSEE